MELNNDNYFDYDMQMKYWGTSQFKTFLECEAKGLAELQGDYIRPSSPALLMGSYVDAYFSNEMDIFTEAHPELFKKNGELLANYKKCDTIIERIEKDKLFSSFMAGEPQKIMTGKVFGYEFKIKIDSYFPGEKIVDLKVMKDFNPIWKNGEKKNFIDAWGYDIQAFIYQEVEYQNSGERLPFYLAVATKEEPCNIEIIHIPQWKINSAGSLVKHYIHMFDHVKKGEIEPTKCGCCDYCIESKVLTGPVEYDALLGIDE